MRMDRMEEMRKIHMEINECENVDDGTHIQKKEAMVMDAMKRVLELNRIARLEGLLALEEAVIDISPESEEEELRQLIMLLVDGVEPEVIKGIGLTRYYSNLYTDYEALRYFLYLEGALSIQAGENPWIVEEKLKTMLPAKLYRLYFEEQICVRKKVDEEKGKKLIENLCKGERLWNSNESGYYVSKLTDYLVCDMSDKEIQRVMREVDNFTWALAMKGMSGKARKRIFDNLSERLAKMVAEDMANLRPVRVIDILEASQKILKVVIYLVDRGELAQRYEYLEPFYGVFNEDTESVRQKNVKLCQLKRIVEEYEQGAALVREFTE